MQGQKDTTGFIQSFTGSHRFVMDYLLEEVLHQQPESIQTFLQHTSILDRMCGPLCDAILLDPSISGQTTLEYLDCNNLFIVPLDNERRWYRYHHLFGDLLRKRMEQKLAPEGIADLQNRASEWLENNGMILEAFKHAAAANDVERAERLMELKEMPLHIPGVPTTILKWLESLPVSLLNSKPGLWWKQAAMLIANYQTIGVEEKLQATEAALATKIPPGTEMDEWSRNLVGKIAFARAALAATRYQAEATLVYAHRAMEFLHPKNIAYRSEVTQYIGFARYVLGDRDAAELAYKEALSLAQAARNDEGAVMATIRLGQIHELRTQLHQAFDTYHQVLKLIGEDLPPFATLVYIGLARIHYEWNDLDTAEKYGEQSIQLARLCDQVIDRLISSELLMARLKLTRGDMEGAARFQSQAEQNAYQNEFAVRLPDIAAHHVLIHLFNGNINAAIQMAQKSNSPPTQALTLLAQSDPSAALALLLPHRRQMEEKGWIDSLLDTMVLQALALHMLGEKDSARQVLAEALTLAEPGGYIRLFLDHGEPMRLLFVDFRSWIEKQSGDRTYLLQGYVDQILAAFAPPEAMPESTSNNSNSKLIEPLSQRELEVLQLICQGLSNQEIGQRLVSCSGYCKRSQPPNI